MERVGYFLRRIDGQPAGKLNADLAAPRWLGFLTAITGVGFAALAGYGLHAATEVSEIAIIAGLHPVASAAPWLSLACDLLGLVLLVSTVRRRMSGPVRIGALTGLFLVGASGVALGAFALVYDLPAF